MFRLCRANSPVRPYAQDYIHYRAMNSDIDRYIESARPEFEAKLQEWVEIPTISAEPDHKPDIDRGADAAIQYLRSLGADAEKVDTPGNPVVVGRFVTGKDRPVVSLY